MRTKTPIWPMILILLMVAIMGVIFYIAPSVQNKAVNFQLPGMEVSSVANTK